MKQNKRFFILSTGRCYNRDLDTENIINYLKLNGYSFVSDMSRADYIYITTCAVSKEAEDLAIKSIKKVLKMKNKNSKIIVGGCLPKINKKRLLNFDNVCTISPRTIDKLDSILNAKIQFKKIKDSNLLKEKDLKFLDRFRIYLQDSKINKEFFRGLIYQVPFVIKNFGYKLNLSPTNKLYFIKISRGCKGNCSYCSIKFAIGKLKSKPIKRVIDEFERGLREGYKNFMLLSEDAGSYGLDSNTNIVELLRNIFDHKDDYSIRILSLNPDALIRYFDELLPLIENNHKKINFICVPLQSGSDRILRLMKRPYNIKQVENCLSALKIALKNGELRTHIMVGFPGETKEDFQKTMQLIKKIRFDGMGVFTYSDRPNTEASKMKNKIPERIKLYRKVKLMLYYKILRGLNLF